MCATDPALVTADLPGDSIIFIFEVILDHIQLVPAVVRRGGNLHDFFLHEKCH